MIITYHGGACVKLQYGDTSILFNPPSKESPWKTNRANSSVVLVNARHPHIDEKVNNDSFLIHGPGEYEVGGIFIKGFAAKTEYEGVAQVNTLYTFPFEEMKIAFLGFLNHTDLDTAFLEEADDIDVLFVPISGKGTLSPSEAYELSVKLEPRIIIPILFDGEKDPALVQFSKEAGISIDAQDKLTIKRKDIAELENSLVILSPQG